MHFPNLIYLPAGFMVLFLSGEFLVRGGACLAKNFKISTLVVGVTVVSLGTSAPEPVVSVNAALTGHPCHLTVAVSIVGKELFYCSYIGSTFIWC